MLSTARSQTTTVDTFEFTPFMSPWRRTSCPVTPRRDGKTNLKHFLLEQRPLLAIKYPFLTPQQIKRKGRELWSKLSSKDKKTNLAAPLMRLPTPPKGRVYEEMGKHHFPFRFPGDESLSMFSSPLAKSRRKSLPSFPIASVGHQGTNVRMQSFRKANRITNRNDDMLQVRRPAQEKTYADGCRWPCKAPPVIEHADCKQFGILKRSRKTRKTAGDRRVSFAEANCNTPDDLHSDDCSNSNHDNDLQTNGQNVESSPGHRRERLITLNSNAVNGRIPLSENLKRPTEMSGRKINGHSSADRKKKQPGWSKINAALEIEDGGHSDSDDERDFQLACLHGNTKPVLPHGGYVENCNKGELRQRSCKEGLVSGKTGRHRNRQSKTRNMEKEIYEKDHDDNGIDDQYRNGVHFGAGDQQMGQRKTTHQRKMMNYQKAWQDDKKAPSHANRRQHVDYMDIMTVYDVFDDDDDELIDLSQTRFSDYCDNMKHVAEPCRRKTIACVESERVTFMKENEAMMYDQCTSKVDDQIARKCEKFHRCQPGNTTTQRQAKKGRNGSPMCDSVIRSASSPSCYNLRSQKVEQASRGRNEDRKCVRGRIMPHRDECQHGRSGKLGVGCRNTRKNKVAVAPSGVSVQNQELMTPETTEEVIEATLTNIIRAPRKRRATDSDVPGGENMKSQVEVIKGNSIIGKTLMGDGNSRMDRVRKRLVASSNACEQGYLTKKQKMGNGNIDLCRIPTRAANKDGTGTRVSVPRQRPCTRSCLRALSSLSLYDVESGTQMTWQSAVPNCHAEEHDGMSYCRSATRNRVEDQVGGVSSERGNDKGLLKNYDGLKATQRHKARNDLEGENLHLGIVSSETARPRGTRKSQLLPNQNLTNQIPSIPTCMLSSPSSQQSDTPSSQNQDESRSNATSPFPYISPLPPSKTSSGVGASFLSFLTSKHLQSDLDNVTSSSEDEIPTTLGVVRNDVLTRAVRSMQQLTVPPGVAYSPRRITVSSPSVSGISELSELSSFSGAKPSPAPVELGKSLPGPTFNGKSSHRELGPATIPRDEARLGASPMRWRAGRKTKTEAQRVELSKKEPPRVLEPARVKSQQPVEPPRVKHRTCSSLCDLFDDVKPGNKPLYNRRVVASLPAETSGSFTEMFSPGKGDIFL